MSDCASETPGRRRLFAPEAYEGDACFFAATTALAEGIELLRKEIGDVLGN